MSPKPHRFVLVLLIWTALTATGAQIKLKFTGTTDYPFSYPVTLAEATTVHTDLGASQTLTVGNANIFIPKGVDGITLTFDNDRALLSVDMTWTASRMSTALAKITDIELDGFQGLQTVRLGSNSLTWYAQGDIPTGCSVDYGQQTPLTFQVDIGNKINLGRYFSDNWTARWIDSDSGVSLPENYFTDGTDGTVTFGLNLTQPVQLTLSHPSGISLQSYPIRLNKFLYPIFHFTTDGRASNSSLRISSSQYVDGPLIIVYDGEYLESDIWNVNINLPFLTNFSGDISLSANRPEIINRLDLSGLGIDRLYLEEWMSGVNEIDLRDNSLLLSRLPAEILHIPTVHLGQQNAFNLKSGDKPYSFDLTEEIKAGASIQWLDTKGDPLDSDYFTEQNGVYTFVKPVDNITARLTSTTFPDYVITSYPVSVDFDYAPLATLSWSNSSPSPTIIAITSISDAYCRIDLKDYSLKAEVPLFIRLSEHSGATTIFTTDNGSIATLDFSDIGLNSLTLTGADNLKSLILPGHNFTPHNIPTGIPVDCQVRWGEPNEVAIETTEGDIPGVDMIDYVDNYTVDWYYLEEDRPVDPAKFTERTGYFSFSEELGEIYALLTSKIYPSLIFRTSPVDISRPRSGIPFLESTPAYYIQGQTLHLDDGVSATIFDLKGTYVAEIKEGGSIKMSSGIYILRFSDGSSQKIIF